MERDACIDVRKIMKAASAMQGRYQGQSSLASAGINQALHSPFTLRFLHTAKMEGLRLGVLILLSYTSQL